jgi:hypothetical protein
MTLSGIQHRCATAFWAYALLCCYNFAVLADEVWMSRRPHATTSGGAGRDIYLSTAQFLIPFQIAPNGSQPSAVHLYVSTDQGETWQLHGKTNPDAKHFEFRAAAEGYYLFAVKTVDAQGYNFSSSAPPIKILVDTTKPQLDLKAAISSTGRLVVVLEAADAHIDLFSATVRVKTDRDDQWRIVPVSNLAAVGDIFEGRVEIGLPQCREVVIVASVSDLAKNTSEATHHFRMPRTAVGTSDLQLASSRAAASLPGAIPWEIDSAAPPSPTVSTEKSIAAFDTVESSLSENRESFSTTPFHPRAQSPQVGPGRLTGQPLEIDLAPSSLPKGLPSQAEELESPEPLNDFLVERFYRSSPENSSTNNRPPATVYSQQIMPSVPVNEPPDDQWQDIRDNESFEPSTAANPYYSKTRTFSLDYSVQALGNILLAAVELWGSEDGGRTWQKWGVDPDRTSPFDIKVGNDGLFGFRMVIVGEGGIVLGQPTSGDSADVWIHVDTESPACRITRAVAGEGSDAGSVVIKYSSLDDHLIENPISLYFSSQPNGPWTSIASGLENTGEFLWKVESTLPDQVFLKLEAVDKAGNIGVYRLDIPIDVKGALPRGRIQGFRPIYNPS